MTKVKCDYCGKEIERSSNIIARNFKHHFCNNECKGKFQYKSNQIIVKQDCALMTIKDLTILFDTEDLKLVQQYKWHLKRDKTIGNFYVQAYDRSLHIRVSLHRILLNCPKQMEVDHINHNTLDNRKSNLRIVDRQTNANNKGLYKNNKSGYKNIYYNKNKNTYICEIKRSNKVVFRKSRKNINELVILRDEFMKGGDIQCQ